MNLSRYHYSKLSQSDQLVYDKICQGLEAYKNRIMTAVCSNSQEIIEAIKKDRIDFYYVDWSKGVVVDDLVVKMIFSFSFLYDKEQCVLFDAKLKACKYSVYINARQYRIVKSVHDYVVGKFLSMEYDKKEEGDDSLLTPVCHKKASRVGYAKLTKYLLDSMNIENMIVYGKAIIYDEKVEHAWNIVKIDDKCYHLDIGMDRAVSRGYGSVKYDYFCLTDSEIILDHEYESVDVVCDSIEANWFYRCSLIVKNIEEITDRIKKRKQISFNDSYKIMDKSVTKENLSIAVQDAISTFFSEHYSINVVENKYQHIFSIYVKELNVSLK